MTAPDPRDLLDDLLTIAKKGGADAADAILIDSVSIAHAQRLGEIEKLERSEAQDLGLRVFVGQRQAVTSSTDHSEDSRRAMVERAVAMARSVPEDPHTGLADRDLLETDIADLDLRDSEEPSPEALIERAKAAEDAARAVEGVTNSEGAEASFDRARIALATTNGFFGTYQTSRHGVAAAVLAGEGLKMERDYDWSSAIHGADLRDAAAVGREAGERAVRRLNPRKVKSTKVPVVFDPRIAGGLISHVSSAISGAAIARGTSFLKDKMGERIFPEAVNVVDDPHRKRGLRSKPFDGEGVRGTKRAIIENGALTTWLLDVRSANQLKLASTGHASRGTGSPPSPSATNLYMEPGSVSRDELIGAIDDGFYVTELIGMGVNMVTGDYSRGAAGFWIEKGEIAYPVSEVTVAGNLLDMFAQITPANDLTFRYGVDAPTTRIDGMTIAGA